HERDRSLALYLFVFGIVDLTEPGKISFGRLCDRLGIARSRWPSDSLRALDHAVRGVNAALAKLDRAALLDVGLSVPEEIAVVFLEDGDMVRIITPARRQTETQSQPKPTREPQSEQPVQQPERQVERRHERQPEPAEQPRSRFSKEEVRLAQQHFGYAPDELPTREEIELALHRHREAREK